LKDQIEHRVMLSRLFDFYEPVLTEKQREAFRLHVLEDWSLSEVAERLEVTRQEPMISFRGAGTASWRWRDCWVFCKGCQMGKALQGTREMVPAPYGEDIQELPPNLRSCLP
jgi:hypothetical protein